MARRLSALVTSVLILLPALGRAQSALDLEVEQLTLEVKKHLDAEKLTSIQVGPFVLGDTSRPALGTGASIQKSLRDCFAGEGIQVSASAPWRIEGTFVDVDDKKSKGLAVAVIPRLLDNRTNAPLAQIKLKPRGVFGDASILALMGDTVALPPNESRMMRDNRLRISIAEPKASAVRVSYFPPQESKLKGEMPSTAVQAPQTHFRMDILVKTPQGYVPRPVEIQKERAFVQLNKEDVYAVRLMNEHAFEVAAQLSVDGIGIFQFSEEENPTTRRPFHSIIIAPRGEAIVYGWFVTRKKYDEFLITEYAKSAAAELKMIDKVGVITATYAASWEKGKQPPLDEPVDPPTFARDTKATARGLRIGTETDAVAREIGIVRGAVSIRYDR